MNLPISVHSNPSPSYPALHWHWYCPLDGTKTHCACGWHVFTVLHDTGTLNITPHHINQTHTSLAWNYVLCLWDSKMNFYEWYSIIMDEADTIHWPNFVLNFYIVQALFTSNFPDMKSNIHNVTTFTTVNIQTNVQYV